jgi:hypothetical protein
VDATPSLFIQARGVLKKELVQHLRSERLMRRSVHSDFSFDHRHSTNFTYRVTLHKSALATPFPMTETL